MPRYRNTYPYARFIPDAGVTVEPDGEIEWDGPSLGAFFVEVPDKPKPEPKSAPETKENGQ